MKYVFATFEKTGALRYISHLDLMRAMAKLLYRSELPICFSEGFNPHPKLTFAQPLSLFQESICEIAEFRMEDSCPTERETLAKLQAVSPEGLRFTDVRFSERKLPPCKAASYELTFETDMTAEEAERLFAGGMAVLKKTKTQEKTVDISPCITKKRFEQVAGGVKLYCILPCGNEYLNPSYIETFLGDRITDMRVLRTKLFF